MIAIGYVRRSKKSTDKTISLEEQKAQIERYCVKQGFTLAETIIHDGISGTKRERFGVIHESIQKHGASALVVYNLDRLARDVAGLLDTLRKLTKKGIEIHEVNTGKIESTTSSGFIITAVKGVFDELFPILIGEKTTDALRRIKEDGRQYTRIPPFGFEYRDGIMIERLDEQEMIPLIRQCRILGLGARKTKRRLQEAGFRGRMGVSTLHRLLKAPFPP